MPDEYQAQDRIHRPQGKPVEVTIISDAALQEMKRKKATIAMQPAHQRLRWRSGRLRRPSRKPERRSPGNATPRRSAGRNERRLIDAPEVSQAA